MDGPTWKISSIFSTVTARILSPNIGPNHGLGIWKQFFPVLSMDLYYIIIIYYYLILFILLFGIIYILILILLDF